MTATILPATVYDLDTLARRIRMSDELECRVLSRLGGRDGKNWSIVTDLCMAYARAPVWSMYLGDELLGCGGVNPLPDDKRKGAIWFLGTKAADDHPIAMTKACKRFMETERPKWLWMGNLCPTFADYRVRWLERLGFDSNREEAHRYNMPVVSFWAH